MAFDRGKPTLVRTKPKGNVTAPKASPAGLIRPKPKPAPKVVQPVAPKPNITAPRSGSAGRVPPHRVVVAPPTPTIATSRAHTGAGTHTAVAHHIINTNKTAAALATLKQPSAVRAYKTTDPIVQTLLRQGYLRIDHPKDVGLFGLLHKDDPARLAEGPRIAPLASMTKAQQKAYTDAVLKVKLQNPQLMMPGAVKALNLISRPIKAISGATDVLVKGGSLSKAHHALARGFEGKDNKLMSNVIKDLGGPKWLQAVGGFTLDVALDPTTYIGFGLVGAARREAQVAGHTAEASAAAAGATEAEAKAAGMRAAEAAAQKATPTRGIKFTVAGREVPGVARGTAATGRVLKKVTPRPVKKAGGGVKTVAREFDPHIAPPGVSREDHAFGSAATAVARREKTRGLQLAQNTSHGIEEYFPTEQLQADLYHAIETHDYSILPPSLRDRARRLDEIYTSTRAAAVLNKVRVGDVTKSKIPDVPKVTADVAASRRAMEQARSARVAVERAHGRQIRKSGVAEGRAQILVGKSARKKGIKTAEGTTPVRTLSKLERQQSLLTPAEQAVQAARSHAASTAKTHAETVAQAASQRAARTKAYNDLAKAQGPEVAAAKKAYDQAVVEREKVVARETGPRKLKGRTKTDLTKAQQDFPSANLTERVRLQTEGKFAAANAPRKATTPIEMADAKVAAAEDRLTKAQQNAGIAVGFVPHTPRDILEPAAGGGARVEGRRISASTLQKRTDLRTIRAQNAETPGKLLTDAPLLNANYIATLTHATAHSKLNQALVSRGRRVTYGKGHDVQLHEGEALYVVDGANMHEVRPGESKTPHGEYFAVNKAFIEHHLQTASPASERGRSMEIFDHATGLWKKSKTFSLAFQARNAIGDTHMTWLVPGRSARRVAIETGQAIKVLRAQRRMHAAERNLERPTPSGLTIKVGGKRIPAEAAVKMGEDAGVFNTGYMSSELQQLLGRSGEGAVASPVSDLRKLAPGGSKISRLFNDRENIHRIGVMLHGIGQKGMPVEAAGALSRKTHIDYGNITKTERGARRVMPFYTFTARGFPIFLTALAKSPGKYATYEKLIEETAKATGVNFQDAYHRLQTFELQQIPLIFGGKPVKIPDVTPTGVAAKALGVPDPLSGTHQVSWSDPTMLLNWLPDPAHPKQSMQFMADQFMSMITPLIKTPVEAKANYSFFGHRPINDPNAPLVAAPEWAKYLPDSAKKFLHVTPDYLDKQTGKKTWGWSGGAQYAMGQMPALITQASGLLTHGTSLTGQNTAQKLAAAITGVKSSPVDKPQINTINRLLHEYYNVNTPKINTFHQRGIYAANATPEYRRLLDRQKAIVEKVRRLSAQTGRAVPVFTKHTKSKPLTPLQKRLGVGGKTTGNADLSKRLGLPAKTASHDDLKKRLGLP